MVKTDDMNTPEKHDSDELSSPDEYIAGEHDDGGQRGFSLQFDDDDRDSWSYDDERRRNKDINNEDDDYLKDEDEMDIEDDDEIFGEERPAWSIREVEEEEEEEEIAPVVSGVAPAAAPGLAVMPTIGKRATVPAW